MEELCLICCEAIKWVSIGECNHPICHICSLRLRALYKNNKCAICKTECENVVFASNSKMSFNDYNLKSLKKDQKLSIYFSSNDIKQQTLALLDFNCPDKKCSVICSTGWEELKTHVKKIHHSILCDLCIKFKHVFTHELSLYSFEQLREHNKTGDPNDKSFNGHPECGFCSVRYYSYDELYEHCRKSHEQCFLCMRQGIHNQYFVNFESLEKHFAKEHFPCKNAACIEQKFIVFESDIDLQAHIVFFFNLAENTR
jgi:hypothetical protein